MFQQLGRVAKDIIQVDIFFKFVYFRDDGVRFRQILPSTLSVSRSVMFRDFDVIADVLLKDFHVTIDEPYRIIDLVRHPGGQLPDGSQFLRLDELVLRLLKSVMGLVKIIKRLAQGLFLFGESFMRFTQLVLPGLAFGNVADCDDGEAFPVRF